MLYRNYKSHKNSSNKTIEEDSLKETGSRSVQGVIIESASNIASVVKRGNLIYTNAMKGLAKQDLALLKKLKQQNIPVVTVFISGRPLWVNKELNQSDAFVAAWLPGSEGGGISDLLFQRDTSYDFTGRLSFSWPNRLLP